MPHTYRADATAPFQPTERHQVAGSGFQFLKFSPQDLTWITFFRSISNKRHIDTCSKQILFTIIGHSLGMYPTSFQNMPYNCSRDYGFPHSMQLMITLELYRVFSLTWLMSTNIATVPLFRDTNVAAVTSRRKSLLPVQYISFRHKIYYWKAFYSSLVHCYY